MVLKMFEEKVDKFNQMLRTIRETDDINKLIKIRTEATRILPELSAEVSDASRHINNHLLIRTVCKETAYPILIATGNRMAPENEIGNKKTGSGRSLKILSKTLRTMYTVERLYNRPLLKRKVVESVFLEVLEDAIERKRYELTVGAVLTAILNGDEVKVLLDRRTTRVLMANEGQPKLFKTSIVWDIFDQMFEFEKNGINRNTDTPYTISIRLKREEGTNTVTTRPCIKIEVSVYEKEVLDKVIRTQVKVYELDREIPSVHI